jgi:site-specific recombinase XerC
VKGEKMHSSLEQYLEFLHTKRRAPATLKVIRHDLTHFNLLSGTMTVRSGKAGKARRLQLHPDAERLVRRYLESVRCQADCPPLAVTRGEKGYWSASR